MIQLIVNGQTFDFPEQSDSPPWGDNVTDWAQAVTDVLANVTGTGDILQTTAAIANNQSSAANINGLSFDPGVVRGAVIEYTVYRVTTGIGASESVETGTIYLGYRSTANDWFISVVGGGGAGVTFSITSAGQVQYTSTNFSGSSYSGSIKFRARALTQ